jgi:hypothetical protein
MTRLLKFNAALVIVTAALVAMLLALDAASRTEWNVSLLTKKALTAIRGATPNYAYESGNYICACVFVNLQGLQGAAVCNCAGAQQDFPCVVCNGEMIASGNYQAGSSGLQPAGGTSPCNVLGAFAGSCGGGFCNNAIIPIGPCVGDYPVFDFQLIGRRNARGAGDSQPILGSFLPEDLPPLPVHATQVSTSGLRADARAL